MFGFDNLEDLIEADIQYGLFEDDKQNQQINAPSKKQTQKIKSFYNSI